MALVATAGVVQLCQRLLPNPMSATICGALAVSVIAPQLRLQDAPRDAAAGRRAVTAVGLVLVALAVSLVVAWLDGAQLRLAQTADGVAWSSTALALAMGVAEWLALAYRDEVWLRGLPIGYARRARMGEGVTVVYLAAAGACAVALLPRATMPGLCLAAASSAFFAALWLRSGDLWAPLAARFAWAWLSEVAFGGQLLDLAPSRLAHGASAQWPAYPLAAAFALLAWLVMKRPPSALCPPAETIADAHA